MKQLKSLLIFSLLALILSACQIPSLQKTIAGSNRIVTVERAVSAIDAVEMRGFGRLVVTQGAVESLTIEAEDNLIPYLVSEMRGGKLVIRMKPLFSFKTDHPILFHLTVRSIDHLILSGFTEAEIDGLTVESLDVRMKDFTRLTLNDLNAENFVARISGFSRLDAAGIVNHAAVEQKESAVYESAGLNIR